jgi:hypothetical protein
MDIERTGTRAIKVGLAILGFSTAVALLLFIAAHIIGFKL